MDKPLSRDHVSLHKESEYTPKVHIVADYIMWVNI